MKMQRTLDAITANEEKDETRRHHTEDHAGFECDECGGTFQRPLFATVSSRGSVERYYACPRCMTKVSRGRARSEDESEDRITVREHGRMAEKSDDNVSCNHFVGYLRKRVKDAPIPDECLTCSKMVECMLH